MKEFKKGEIVGIRYQTAGTFGGWESDWRAAVYVGLNSDERHLVAQFPAMKDRGFGSELVDDDDIRPAGELWSGLENAFLVKHEDRDED